MAVSNQVRWTARLVRCLKRAILSNSKLKQLVADSLSMESESQKKHRRSLEQPPVAEVETGNEQGTPDTDETPSKPREIGGPRGLEPTRYGDWESKGRCVDF